MKGKKCAKKNCVKIKVLKTWIEPTWRRRWHPTPGLLPGKSHGQRSLGGCSPWGHEKSDTTEWLHFHFHALEKEMGTHSSVLAWRIPGTGSLVGCHLRGCTESDTTERRSSSSIAPPKRVVHPFQMGRNRENKAQTFTGKFYKNLKDQIT